MSGIRPIGELKAVDDPAWPRLLASIQRASVPVRVLPVDRPSGEQTLYRLQVTATSTLGAVALNTGGVLIDHGWLRLLGSGASGLPDLATANGLGPPAVGSPPPASLTVAYDVLGGRFAINGGGLVGQPGEVCFWGPDTLEWTPIGAGHAALVQWALTGGLADFYRHLRWPGWEGEVAAVPADHGISTYPFLFTAQGRDLARVSRRAVPFGELLSLHEDLARQVGDLPPGTAFHVQPVDGPKPPADR